MEALLTGGGHGEGVHRSHPRIRTMRLVTAFFISLVSARTVIMVGSSGHLTDAPGSCAGSTCSGAVRGSPARSSRSTSTTTAQTFTRRTTTTAIASHGPSRSTSASTPDPQTSPRVFNGESRARRPTPPEGDACGRGCSSVAIDHTELLVHDESAYALRVRPCRGRARPGQRCAGSRGCRESRGRGSGRPRPPS